MKKIITISLLFIISSALQAVQLPRDFKAVYLMEKYGATVIEMNLTLSTKDNHITYKSHSETRGMLAFFSKDRIDEISKLQWDDKTEQIYLNNYRFDRKEKTKKNQQFSLLRDSQNTVTATGTYSGQAFNLVTSDPVWDRLSVQLALALDLLSTDEIQKKYSYNIIDKAQVSQYHFEFINKEILRLGDKKYDAIKMKRPHTSGNRITYLWLARDLDFLPVKIEQYRNNELHMSMFLDRFSLKKKKS